MTAVATREPSTATPACGVRGVHKRYGGVHALRGVDLDVFPGSVHAIVGENGAGKSTLMKLLAGAEQPDEGTVLVNGERVELRNVSEANRAGTATVFQELSLFPALDVLANLFLLREPRRAGLVSRRQMRRVAAPVLSKVGLDVDVDRPVATFSLGERQLIEIAHALLLQADRVLILDEPNSALNAGESARLFDIIRQLRDAGTAVIYVSHRLEEVFAIADTITVVRNGSVVSTASVASTTIHDVVAEMIGREPAASSRRRVQAPLDTLDKGLRVESLEVSDRLRPVSFEARRGEIVGLAGLEGAGVADVFSAVMGLRRPDGGRVVLPSGEQAPASLPASVRKGVAYVPSDRREAGLALEHSVADNLSQVTAGTLARHGFVLRRAEIRAEVGKRMSKLRIKADSMDVPVGTLSGGNQQKVVLGKWLEACPDVFLLDDPTRGVDIGAKQEIYGVIAELAEQQRVVLFSSSELSEYVLLCDRVLVFYRGRAVGELAGEALDDHRLLHAINTGLV